MYQVKQKQIALKKIDDTLECHMNLHSLLPFLCIYLSMLTFKHDQQPTPLDTPPFRLQVLSALAGWTLC